MKKSILPVVAASLLFAACSNSTPENTTGTEATQATETPAETTPPAAEAAPAAEITISGDDAMKFDLTEIKVKAGQTVKLTLKHTGKSPKTAMGHNFVLLEAGTDVANFAKEAIAAKDNDYIPKSMEDAVIAHTPTIGGGESAQIEFTAPDAGTYDFLCSFPGHFGTMKGKFIVE